MRGICGKCVEWGVCGKCIGKEWELLRVRNMWGKGENLCGMGQILTKSSLAFFASNLTCAHIKGGETVGNVRGMSCNE